MGEVAKEKLGPPVPKLRLHKVEFIATATIINDDGKALGDQPIMEAREGPNGQPTQHPIVVYEAEIPEAFYTWLRSKGVKV